MVKIGNVYRISMTEEDGVKPKAGDKSRNKFFIVLGFDNDGTVYGGVIINSEINKHLPPNIKIYHMPIMRAKYPFLDYDSFVDCLRLKTANPNKFSKWKYLGDMDEYDLSLIIGTIKESPVENIERLTKFGL